MKRLFILSALILTASFSNAQLLKNMKDKVTGGGSDTSTEETSYQSLSEVAKSWADGDYSARRENGGMWEPQGKKPVKFNKDEKGEITSIEVNGTTFHADVSEASPFVMSFYNRNEELYLTSTSIVQYRRPNGGTTVFPEWCWGDKKGVSAFKKEIEAYRVYGKEQISSEKDAFAEKKAEEAEKAEAERRAKYGLEDKDVAKIEIINLNVPEKFGHYTGFSFGMKATLKDGSVITTEDGTGYMSDYEVSYDKDNYEYGKLGKGYLSDDKIKVTVKLKSKPSVTTSKDVVLKYNQDITNKWNGTSWSRGAGENAMNFKIEVKQVKHAVTGEDLLKVRITNVSNGGEIIDEYKIGVDQTVHFFCNGGNGGTDDGRGNDGGNAGNLTVVKDPNVKVFNLDYSNKGGRGGKGSSSSYDGRDGRDGVFKEEVRAVNL